MSERAAPETDAFITSQDYYPTGHQWRNFTRKLERERDEARSLTEHQWLLKVGSRLFVAGCKSDGIIDSLDEIIRERDEAREQLAAVKHFLEKYIAERDEAREQLAAAKHFLEKYIAERDEAVTECKSLWSLVNANKLRAYKAERECDRLKEALGYIAHAGLSARHIEDYAKEFLRREEDAK